MNPSKSKRRALRPPSSPRPRSGAASPLAVVVLGIAAACTGCAGDAAGPDTGDALFVGELLPDMLTESDSVEPPASLAGNRFLAGWRPSRRGDGKVLLAVDGRARIELVRIARQSRSLVLDVEAGVGSADRAVEVIAAGRELGTYPVADPLRIPLPPDLPLGRVTVALETRSAAAAAPLTVTGARLLPAAPAGKAGWSDDWLNQSAASLFDYVRPVPAGAILTGELEPPKGWRSDQRFEVIVEGPDGERVAGAAFTGGWWSRLRGGRSIALPLGDEAGLRRFRFLASGPPGPLARWRHLRISPPAVTAPEPETPPGAVPPPPRLVVVYVMDALRADHVGHLGERPGISPAFDSLAAEGATFLRHQSVAPNTLPSTKALFVGRALVRRGGGKLPHSGPPTLAELFRKAGYRTGLFSGNVYVGPAYRTDRGFEHVGGDLRVIDSSAPYNDNAARVHAAALTWLEELRPDERAFAYLHTIHPHNPYDPPPELARHHTAGIPSVVNGSARTLLDIKQRRLTATAADRRRLQALYSGSFAYNDRELAKFLERLDRLVPASETLLVVTSDHGEELFDHGGVLHGYTLYEEMLRIPLVFHRPSAIVPARHDFPTDTLDLHATLLELGGLDRSAGTEGASLAATLVGAPASGPAEPKVQFAAAASLRGGIFSARTDRWKVVWAPRTGRRWGMGEGLGRSRDAEYLFDLHTDPAETVNLAGGGDLEAAWLRSRLLAWIHERRAAGDEVEEPGEVDPETLRELRALGYL